MREEASAVDGGADVSDEVVVGPVTIALSIIRVAVSYVKSDVLISVCVRSAGCWCAACMMIYIYILFFLICI